MEYPAKAENGCIAVREWMHCSAIVLQSPENYCILNLTAR